eukprot:2763113-Amphidinium_carterae.2
MAVLQVMRHVSSDERQSGVLRFRQRPNDELNQTRGLFKFKHMGALQRLLSSDSVLTADSYVSNAQPMSDAHQLEMSQLRTPNHNVGSFHKRNWMPSATLPLHETSSLWLQSSMLHTPRLCAACTVRIARGRCGALLWKSAIARDCSECPPSAHG